MAEPRDDKAPAALITGILGGGLMVVVGIVLMFVWSFWIGLVVALLGVSGIAVFVRARWTSS
jgi:hypothetical protein